MESELTGLFLTYSAKVLEQMTAHIETCLTKLGDDGIGARAGAHENAPGNLVLHLQGNVRQWIIHGVGGAPDVRERDLEFSTTSGWTAAGLSASLRETMNEAIQIIGKVSPDRMTERITPQHDTLSVLEAIYKVVGHFQQHTGQIMYATKQISGDSLGLYQPPAKATNPV